MKLKTQTVRESGSTATPDFDPIWEQIYRDGQNNRYPWDAVVSFVCRNRPQDKAITETDVLEIGCGTASNLWFAAREGFQVAGIDASETAIETALSRFRQDGLAGDLRIGNFMALPFADNSFDLAIDRAGLTCVGNSIARRAINEVQRVLRPGGLFFCNVYSDRHSSHSSGMAGPDAVTLDIAAGSLVGVGQVCFYSEQSIRTQFPVTDWSVKALDHVSICETLSGNKMEHAEWRLIAQKK